jgi:O-antigen/teichoic acid export membrane protein
MSFRMLQRGLRCWSSQGAQGTLLRGAANAGLAKTTSIAAMFGCHIVLARTLGVEEYGAFAVARSWIDLVLLLALLGLDQALVRFVARYRTLQDHAALHGVLRWSKRTAVTAGLVVGAAVVLTATLLRSRLGDSLWLALAIGGLTLPLLAATVVRQTALCGFKRAGLNETPLAIIRPMLLIAGLIGLWLIPDSSVTAAWAMAINGVGLLVALAVAERWLRREMPARTTTPISPGPPGEWLRVSLPMMLDSTLRVAVNEIDIIVIGIVLGPVSAGIYAVALNLARLIAFGLMAGNTICGPLIAELQAQSDLGTLQATVRLACRISTGVALAVGGLLVLARSLALDAFGEAFQAGSMLVLILAAGQFVNAVTGPVGPLLTMTGHQNIILRITLVIAALNVGLSYPATALWGMEGAAAVTGVLVAVRNLWSWWEVRRNLGISALPLDLNWLRIPLGSQAPQPSLAGTGDTVE